MHKGSDSIYDLLQQFCSLFNYELDAKNIIKNNKDYYDSNIIVAKKFPKPTKIYMLAGKMKMLVSSCAYERERRVSIIFAKFHHLGFDRFKSSTS